MKFPLPCRTSTCYNILILIILSALEEVAGIDTLLTPKKLNGEVLRVEQEITRNETMNKMEKSIEHIMGPIPQAGQADQEGIYNRFLQAYHFNVYGTRLFDRGEFLVKDWADKLTLIRRHQLEWKSLNESVTSCKNAFEKVEKATVGKGKEDLTLSYFGNCSAILIANKTEWKQQIEETTILAYHLMAMAFHLACDQGGDAYRINGARVDRLPGKASKIQTKLTTRLMSEYKQAGDEIENHLESLKTHISEVDQSSKYGKLITSEYNRIVAKLSSEYPFDKLYVPDKNKRQADYDYLDKRLSNNTAYKENCHSIHLDIQLYYFFTDDTKFAQEWQANFAKLHVPNSNMDPQLDPSTSLHPWQIFYRGYPWNDPVDGKLYYVSSVVQIVDDFYYKYWEIDTLKPDTDEQKSNAFKKWGIKWDWQIEGEAELNFMHRARLGSDLLDSVAEELKCYLNLTYTEEKRKETIENYNQLTDWKKAKLFMNESKTLFRPCVTENDTDLIGTCTRENHEICGPTYYDTIRQDPLNEAKGGLSLMKPKWMYRKVNGICKGIRTYVTHYKICQCGFRMDCGDDLNAQITCQLVENDLVRKQCRGSIGYPCMTHPLAPGEHHRSCVTGYCDKEENSCVKFHHYFFE